MTFDLVLIGLAIAFDPIPLTTFMIVLPSKRGARKGAAFVFGWLVSLAIVVAVTVLATTALAVRIAIGVVLVTAAIRTWRRMRRPKKPKKPPKWQEHVDHMSGWFAMGLAQLPRADPVVCVLASSSYLAPDIYAGFMPAQSQAFLVRFRTWTDTHTG